VQPARAAEAIGGVILLDTLPLFWHKPAALPRTRMGESRPRMSRPTSQPRHGKSPAQSDDLRPDGDAARGEPSWRTRWQLPVFLLGVIAFALAFRQHRHEQPTPADITRHHLKAAFAALDAGDAAAALDHAKQAWQ